MSHSPYELTQTGLEVEGIFRLSGEFRRIDEIIKNFEEGEKRTSGHGVKVTSDRIV